MAKCSKEQRDRAVDLYIRYERCAANVIRVLGYPSRGSLWMWYKDRLEEEHTGVPSGRGNATGATAMGGNRPRWTITSNTADGPARTMRMLEYPKSKELLMAWIDKLAPGQRKLRHGRCPSNEAGGGGRGRVRTVGIT